MKEVGLVNLSTAPTAFALTLMRPEKIQTSFLSELIKSLEPLTQMWIKQKVIAGNGCLVKNYVVKAQFTLILGLVPHESLQKKHIAVYPVSGWWKELKSENRRSSIARFSLIISIETPENNLEIHNEIESLIAIENTIQSPILIES